LAEPRSRPYHHGDLRSMLLNAAEQELSKNGIEGFSLRGVAKRAGVSHAAPAHHFTDSNGLLTALAAIGFERLSHGLRTKSDAAGDEPRTRLIAGGRAYIDFAMANPALFRLMFSSDRPDFSDADLCKSSETAFRQLADDVGAVSGDGGARASAQQADIAATWAVTHGLADLLSAGRLKMVGKLPEPDRDRMIGEIISRVL